MFGEEQARLWIRLKAESSDPAFSRAEQQLYLNEMRGAHLQLLSLAITKQYRDIEIAMEVSTYIKSFLATFGTPELEDAKDWYNKAFGSSPSDGVLQMAQLFSTRVAKGTLSKQSVAEVREMFYLALESIFGDFKQVKIVAS